jgi:hypothetical protein
MRARPSLGCGWRRRSVWAYCSVDVFGPWMSVTAAWTASHAHDGGSVERERRGGGAEAWSGPMRNSSNVKSERPTICTASIIIRSGKGWECSAHCAHTHWLDSTAKKGRRIGEEPRFPFVRSDWKGETAGGNAVKSKLFLVNLRFSAEKNSTHSGRTGPEGPYGQPCVALDSSHEPTRRSRNFPPF